MLLTCTCVCRYWTAPDAFPHYSVLTEKTVCPALPRPSHSLAVSDRCRVSVAAVGARGDRGCAAARGPRSPAVLLTPGRPAIECRHRWRRCSGSAHTLVIDDDAHSPHNVLISHRTRAAAVCPPPYLSSVFIVIFCSVCLSLTTRCAVPAQPVIGVDSYYYCYLSC